MTEAWVSVVVGYQQKVTCRRDPSAKAGKLVSVACVPLIIAGGGVQIAGFGLALTQSVRTRLEQSPAEQSFVRLTRAWSRRRGGQVVTWVRVKTEPLLVRLHLRRPRSVSVNLSNRAGASTSAVGYLSKRRRDLALSERVDRLEDDVDDLRRKQSEDHAHLEGRVDEVRSDIETQQAAQESERARQLGRSLRYEELGIGLFIVGVVMATAGSVV